ncbi:MAG TPA: NADH-quinone oxidoreductase subunit J [Rhizomicrobium sp.]|nr:NADH-quinone oxidoreductase subunit J [Rhizomicrobium sp.]
MLTTLAFYLFSAVLIGSALMVIASRNPVHSVLFLILAFFNAAALFILLGAEFLALILLIVYVGAVAVLFLFVVMMLDIDFAEMKRGALRYLPLGLLIGAILVAELVVFGVSSLVPSSGGHVPHATPAGLTNTEAFGYVLYTGYIYYFETAGLVLLVAMIGAIVLTLRHKPGVRRQKIGDQTAREPALAIRLVDVQPGQGG